MSEGLDNYHMLPMDGYAIPTASMGYIKGWTRAVCFLFVIITLMQNDLVKELPMEIFDSYCTVHAVVRNFGSHEERINVHREITLGSTTTRKRPNCFVHYFQIRKLMASGATAAGAMAKWSTHALGQILGIGPEEAKAAVNLAVNVPSAVREELQTIAQKFGMRNGPFNHSVLAHQFFSIGKGPLHPVQAWQEALANTEDALKLLVQRLHNDWLALPPALRKAPSIQEFMGLQSRCAAYLHNLELLRVLVSEELFKAEKEKLDRKFLAKYMDMVEARGYRVQVLDEKATFRFGNQGFLEEHACLLVASFLLRRALPSSSV
jgi:hypothetical protein